MTEYISRDLAITLCPNVAVETLRRIPAADVVPVVRCRECKYWQRAMSSIDPNVEFVTYSYCIKHRAGNGGDFFCSDGERKDGEA